MRKIEKELLHEKEKLKKLKSEFNKLKRCEKELRDRLHYMDLFLTEVLAMVKATRLAKLK
jgi:hypothetical protein